MDPNEDGRALLYMSTPTSDLELPNLIVTDISGAREGRFTELVQENANALFPEDVRETNDVALHSMSVNYSGTRLHLAYLGGGYLIADSSDLARGATSPKIRLITPVSHRVPYDNPGAHSVVKVPGRPYAVITEEVYGDFLDELIGADEHGCPWGWMKIADICDPSSLRSSVSTASRRTRSPTASRRQAATRATSTAPATQPTTPRCCRTWRS